MKSKELEAGAVNPLVISNVVVGTVAILFAGLAIWSFINYSDQKNNVDSKIDAAVSAAKTDQKAEDEADFLERYKLPTQEFVGASDFGSVRFQYPKTWSVYVAEDGSGSTYEAYLNKGTVPPISTKQSFAVRVVVDNESYDDTLKSYDQKIKSKDLVSSSITIGSYEGIRLDGTFSKERKGTAVIFKVRDKTLTIANDLSSEKNDFEETVLKTLSFNP